jgi:hypothetical protein
MSKQSEIMTQLPNGRWVPAQDEPFWEDTRPWYVRLYHCWLVIRGYSEDEIDNLIKPYYVPLEPPVDRPLDEIRG